MSTDPSGAVPARFAAAGESSSRMAALSYRDLADLADVIARIEMLLNAEPMSDGSRAIERIADIAFVLHERDVEASLCDALDAAVREIGAAGALQQVNAHRAHQAAELLRALSLRLNEIIARAAAGCVGTADEAAVPPVEVLRGGSPIIEIANGKRMDERGSSAAVRAAPPMRLPEPPLDPEDDPGDLFEPITAPSTAVRPEPQIEAAAAFPVPPEMTFAAPLPEKANTLATIPKQNCVASVESVLQSRPQSAQRERVAMPAAEAESLGDVSPVGVLKPPEVPPADIAAGPLPRSHSGPAQIDPLAPVCALSEEELIALFS